MSVQQVPASRRSPIITGLLAGVMVLIAIAGFGEALSELVTRWYRQEEYSHGFLVPLIAAWLLWMRRDAAFASMGRPAWSGVILILIAAALHITGEISAIFLLSQIGFIVALLGIALGIGGWSLLRVTFIPTVFLFFAIPLPYFVEFDAVLAASAHFV